MHARGLHTQCRCTSDSPSRLLVASCRLMARWRWLFETNDLPIFSAVILELWSCSTQPLALKRDLISLLENMSDLINYWEPRAKCSQFGRSLLPSNPPTYSNFTKPTRLRLVGISYTGKQSLNEVGQRHRITIPSTESSACA